MELPMIQYGPEILLVWNNWKVYKMKSQKKFLTLVQREGVAFIDLPLLMIIHLDLSAQQSKPAHFRVLVHQ